MRTGLDMGMCCDWSENPIVFNNTIVGNTAVFVRDEYWGCICHGPCRGRFARPISFSCILRWVTDRFLNNIDGTGTRNCK